MSDLISRQDVLKIIRNHIKETDSEYVKSVLVNLAECVKDTRSAERTGRWIETEGLDAEIRCIMCTNPMRSDRGCDGSCQYDEKLYKQIMSIIKDRIDGGGA